MSDWLSPSPLKPNPKRNEPTYMECKTIRNVVSSEAEAEAFVTFNDGEEYLRMQTYLITLDQKQPATPLKTDNYMTGRFVNLGL